MTTLTLLQGYTKFVGENLVEGEKRGDSETYSEPCQTSKVKCFGKIVNSFIFAKHSILDV